MSPLNSNQLSTYNNFQIQFHLMIHCLVYLLCKGGFTQKMFCLENVFQKSNVGDFLPFMLKSTKDQSKNVLWDFFFFVKNLRWLAL